MSSKQQFYYGACPGLALDEQGRPIPMDRPRYDKDDMLAAAFRGETETVLAAIADGKNVDFTDERTGLSALHIAVGSNNLPLTRALVETCNASFFSDRFGRWPSVVALECKAGDEMADYICHAEARFLGMGV